MEAVLPVRRRSYGSIRSPNVKRDNQSIVVIKGWLFKLEGGALKQWKRRWCVLSDFCLFFYKSPDEDKVFSSVLLPSCKVSPCSSEDRISKKFAFKVEHQNMKTYFFAAEDKENMKRWMNAMSLASIMQNPEKTEKMESGISSTSYEEDDSGFTSYRSRHYYDQDPNSTFEGSHYSDGMKQRSHSCSDRVNEMYLNNDDKYPTFPANSQQYYSNSTSKQSIPRRQPLYANAPPKPRRLTQSEPFAIAPTDQYDDKIAYVNHRQIPYQYQEPSGVFNYPGYPHLTYSDPMVELDPIPYQDYRRETNFQETIPYSNSYPSQTNPEDLQEIVNSYERPPRPHSADFLERETECFSPSTKDHKTQPRRPKSSLEYCDKYWETEESNNHYDHQRGVNSDDPYVNQNNRLHRELQPYDDQFRNLNYNVDQSYFNSTAPVHSYAQNSKYLHQEQPYPQQPYTHELPSSQPIKKKKAHEESMRRLMEWKQRMLQSPLSRKHAQYSSSSSDASSPRRLPGQQPPNYHAQVMRDLAAHEARVRQKSQHIHSDIQPAADVHPVDQYYRSELESNAPKSQPANTPPTSHPQSHSNPNSIPNRGRSNRAAYSSEKVEQTNKTCHMSNQQNILYCVDSENNELLIYGDNYVADVPNINEEAYYSQKRCNVENVMTNTKAISCKPVPVKNVKITRDSVDSSISVKDNKVHSPSEETLVKVPPPQPCVTSYSSDDEASVDTEYVYKQKNSKSKISLNQTKNVSDSEIQVREPCHLKKLVQLSEGVMNKGKRLSVSAGDLLGKTHEELVLLLIQLRRNQARIVRAKEKCLQQLENVQQFSTMNECMKQMYTKNFSELMQQVTLLEKQFEATRPLINLVDNMVKLGSLYGSNDKRSSSYPHLEASCDFSSSQERVYVNMPLDSHAWSSTEETELQGHLNEMRHLDQGLSRETHSFSSLQQDKEMLEYTLHGMKNKILDHQDKPIELQKLRKQQRMIEKELTRVKRLLSHSAKKIEDATTKNDQLEQQILLLRQKLQQVLKTGSNELKSSQARADLEAELSRVQNVLEELANHRQEISNTVETLKSDCQTRVALCSSKVRASPTGVAGSAPLPLRKKQQSTYFETDLDTMQTYDLSTIGRDADDIPVYANADELNNSSQESSNCEKTASHENGKSMSSGNSDKENVSQCPMQDINEADDRMKRFYGILPREKPCEIKTVRIVKRQSERRNKERDKKRVTYGDQSSVWVVEEPDFSSDDHIETDEETFKKTDAFLNCSRPTSIPLITGNTQRQPGYQSARERLFGSSGSIKTDDELTMNKNSNSVKTIKRSKRRHYTISGCQYLSDPQFSEISREKPRSRDDVDMERCLRTANTPDIVRSTIKKKEVYDEKIIERELGLPQKIKIPERYIEDEPERLSASEKLRRSRKAENIRKMLSETTATYENVAVENTRGPPEKLHEKCTEQKRKRAHLLALNHALAQEVMQRSKAVAANIYSMDDELP